MTDVTEEAVGRRILRLLAVERGLQDEGQGNAARLFRAAALGEALRATRVHPRLGRGLEQAATDIIAELRAVGREELAALMDRAGRWRRSAPEAGPRWPRSRRRSSVATVVR